MSEVDFKQLQIFAEIYRTSSLTRAADSLGLGQPAVSMALAKLRKHYNDALFVRTPDGMAPTPLAGDLIGSVRATLNSLKTTLQHRTSFDPATSDRMFHICMTDVGQRVVMPRLLAHLRLVAPRVRLDLRYLSENTGRELESGEIDVAIGFLSDLKPGLFQQKLFSDRFVCVANRDHPRLSTVQLTREQFEAESHIVVATQGTGHSIIERTLERHHVSRHIGLIVPNYLGVISHIASTEYLAIVPERFGTIISESNSINVFELPFKIPSYKVMQHWHERFAREPSAKWLRETIAELFCTT
jgi:DNA-binding transcriptional LysR family regulator